MIYILSNDPSECAKLLDDKSLGKMISACAMLFCNVHSLFIHPFKAVDKDGQWTAWTKSCLANYNILLAYAKACCEEWLHRFNHCVCGNDETVCIYHTLHEEQVLCRHEHHDVIEWCEQNKPDLPNEKICTSCNPIGSGYSWGHDPLPCHNCDAKEPQTSSKHPSRS